MNAKRLGMVAVVGVVGLCGCEAADPVGVGENEAPVEEQPAEETWPQTWVGYAEMTSWFADDSDQITIVVNEEQTGTVVFGTAEPPALRADHTFPPEYLSPTIVRYPVTNSAEIVEGVPYTLLEFAYSELRLEASIFTREPYGAACAGLSAEDARTCELLPGTPTMTSFETNTCSYGAEATPFPCELLAICNDCTCNDGTCSRPAPEPGNVYFDLSRSGDRMDGMILTFATHPGAGTTSLSAGVHLVRQQ